MIGSEGWLSGANVAAVTTSRSLASLVMTSREGRDDKTGRARSMPFREPRAPNSGAYSFGHHGSHPFAKDGKGWGIHTQQKTLRIVITSPRSGRGICFPFGDDKLEWLDGFTAVCGQVVSVRLLALDQGGAPGAVPAFDLLPLVISRSSHELSSRARAAGEGSAFPSATTSLNGSVAPPVDVVGDACVNTP